MYGLVNGKIASELE